MSPNTFLAPAGSAAVASVQRVWVTLGGQLRDARLRRHWSVAELAGRAGVSRSMAYLAESGRATSIEAVTRLGAALGLRLDASFTDARHRFEGAARTTDVVHAEMGEVEAGRLRRFGFAVGVDEPYQHFQFAGRADVCAWDLDRHALLHFENKTRFPDIQEVAGAFNAKRAYLGASLAARLGIGRWRSETHVLVGLWSAETLHAFRLRRETFAALCPDPVNAFASWWAGDAPATGMSSALVFLDPLGSVRQKPFIDMPAARDARPRHRGYADVARALAHRAR